MMEEILEFEVLDGKKIQCFFDQSKSQRSDKAVIVAHGLTGHPEEYVHLVAKNYFLDQGYDVYRISFYAEDEGFRKLEECTLRIHSFDLDCLIEQVKKSYADIFVCGHSYGGMTLLLTNPKVNALAFWDSSYMPYDEFWQNKMGFVKELDGYKVYWGGSTLILPRIMYEEAKNISCEDSIDMASKIQSPSIVLKAEKGGHDNCEYLYNTLKVSKDFHIVKGADHCFVKGQTALELMEKTHQWFDKF